MNLRQPDFDILEALYLQGGSGESTDVQKALNRHGPSSVAAFKKRLQKLDLLGLVVRTGSKIDLTIGGREHFLDELSWREPESPLLQQARKRKSYVLSAEVEQLDEGGYLARCPEVPGCHAEGLTVGEALENLEDLLRVFLEIRGE